MYPFNADKIADRAVAAFQQLAPNPTPAVKEVVEHSPTILTETEASMVETLVSLGHPATAATSAVLYERLETGS